LGWEYDSSRWLAGTIRDDESKDWEVAIAAHSVQVGMINAELIGTRDRTPLSEFHLKWLA
jgi:hypothetical protein